MKTIPQKTVVALAIMLSYTFVNAQSETNSEAVSSPATATVSKSTPTPPLETKKRSFTKEGNTDAELAQKLNNPVAALILAPFQFNFDFSIGKDDGWRNITNFQPVIPFQLSDDWNLITRTVVPYIYMEDVVPADLANPNNGKYQTKQGLSDTTLSLFFSPHADIGETVWGVGPAFLFPTATNTMLGTEKWGAGPAFILLKQTKTWTFGGLANHIWSFAGDKDRDDVSVTFLQPFVSYLTPALITFTFTTETTYDWEGEEWTVPLDFLVSKLVSVGKEKISLVGGFRSYAVRPDGGPDWGVRFVVVFIL